MTADFLLTVRRLLLVCVVAMTVVQSARAQEPESFGGNIILGRPTDRSITVNVLFTADHDSVYLEYGDKSGALDKQTPLRQSIKANVPYQEVIGGLFPNHRYYYRVCYKIFPQDAFGASAEHTFHTQRARGSTFTFTVIADSHLFTDKHCLPERYAQTLANAHSDNPDFHIDLGDTFRSDSIVKDPGDLTYQLVLDREIAHRPFFNIVTADAPLFLVNGNHDSEYLYYTQPASGENPNLPLWAANARISQYPNPVPDTFYSGDTRVYPNVVNSGLRQSYYAWEWGEALFVVLDPYWEMAQKNTSDWNPVHGDAQYFWFRETLRNSKARHKFVFEHHVLGQGRGGVEVASEYEWGGQDPRRTRSFQRARLGWDKPMHQLMAENGVNVYFQGHDHLYAMGILDGVTYVTVPMPGAAPDPEDPDYYPDGGNSAAYGSSEVLPNSGHVRVAVSPSGVNVEYVSVKLPGRDKGVNKAVAAAFRISSPLPVVTTVSAATFAPGGELAPGSIVSSFGEGLSPAVAVAEATPLPTSLSGASVRVTDSRNAVLVAPLFFVSPNQINYLVPEQSAVGPASVTVFNGDRPVASGTFRIDRLAPGLFTANANGKGIAAAVALKYDVNGTQTWRLVSAPATPVGLRNPVLVALGAENDRVYLLLFGTGMRGFQQKAEATIGNVPVAVAGPVPQGQFEGLDQINLGPLPRSLAGRGESAIQLSVDGKPANTVTVSIQ